jgi:peptidyl-prolyl cis-trans isomerase A (cyclophilin A)
MNRRMTIAALAAPLLAQEKNLRVVVKMETELGEIVVALSGDRAPGTVENFLRYVDGGAYDGGVFHRTVKMDNQPQSPVKIEVIQGGPNPSRKAGGAPIALERTTVTGLRHVDGAISMARFAPDSATSDFFICIGNQPELDFGGKRNPDGQGFAAFGMVLKGMDVVRKIQMAPNKEGQKLTPPVKIQRIARQ